MANPEHLAILEQGVEVWNQWREENPDIEVQIYEADLKFKDFRGVNFNGLDLSFTNLLGCKLNRADFSEANLLATDFTGAFLSNAKFRRARLSGTRFIESGLEEADFWESTFSSTIVIGSDMSEAIGLESCSHFGPSFVDHTTLAQSGDLPIEFLRGCGLPDFIIDNIDLLHGDAIQFYSCFISYSSKDEAFARQLYADLQNNGVRCWFAPEDMRIGDRIRYAIDEAIRLREKLLLVLSATATESAWVEAEVETALEEERERNTTVLFPIRIDDAVMDTSKPWARQLKNTRHIGDFRDWKNHDDYQTAFERLLQDLKNSA